MSEGQKGAEDALADEWAAALEEQGVSGGAA